MMTLPDRRTFLRMGSMAACTAALLPPGACLAQATRESMPVICAHRGWRDPSRFENTLEEMRHTLRSGPFMMEIDLTSDADGTIFLMHDQDIDRVTTGHGPLAALDNPAVRALRMKNGRGEVRGRVTAYRDVVRWAAGEPTARLMLDIKAVAPADALAPVRQAGLSGRVVVLTFARDVAHAAFAADPDVLVSVLITRPADIGLYVTMAAGRRFAAYIPRHADPALFHAAHNAGAVVITDLLGAGALTDAMTPEAGARWAHGLPIDILVTNTPIQLRAAFQSILHATG
ncbi:glycerophosphodiester phosphodiesterase family protein [Komagataeibacter oboediens]|nr:glycerophosphodiester phosphodiesterase family protein [Komagataeibacter oboediens]